MSCLLPLFVSCSVQLGKCTSMVVLQNFPSQLEVNAAGNGDYSHIISYVFIVGMVITLLTQTHLLNMAIMHGDTLTVFPFFQVKN